MLFVPIQAEPATQSTVHSRRKITPREAVVPRLNPMSSSVNSGDLRGGGPSRQMGEHAPEQTTRDASAPYRSGGDGDDCMDRSAKRRRVTVACAHCRCRKSRVSENPHPPARVRDHRGTPGPR